MAWHNYHCPACGFLVLNRNVPISIGGKAGAPVCARCRTRMCWTPASPAMDAYEPFEEFVTTNGQGHPVLIESARKRRQIEQESRHMAANGEGQMMVWRDAEQDSTNRDQHVFGAPNRGYNEDVDSHTNTKDGVTVPFRRDGRTAKGEKILKGVGSQVTDQHGTI